MLNIEYKEDLNIDKKDIENIDETIKANIKAIPKVITISATDISVTNLSIKFFLNISLKLIVSILLPYFLYYFSCIGVFRK